jgi:N-acyl-D-aspartate/D-glutamate deacylase
VRAKILSEKTDKLAGDGTPIPPLADVLLANIDKVAMRMFPLGARPEYEPKLIDCIAGRAARGGTSVLAAIYDALLEEDGKALLYFPIYNYTSMNLDTVREMLVHPRALVGLGDAGAHVGTVCDASMPVFVVGHWGPRLGIERMVRMQTHDTARFIGLADRGTLEVGMRADINIIELPRLTLKRPELVRDLPAGGKRLFQQADGFAQTIVGGAVIAEGGALTGARPGRLVRMGGGS